ncbi:DMT family transporter [Halorubrum sp. DTA46]|uniref:DMT family transporter n=1 Tax=Halorubrum sp. DTA46 TaxID=3402162 RepID=UPI003AAF5F5E
MGRRAWTAYAPLLAAAFWGGMYVVSKWGFDAIPPLTLAFLRVAVGAAVLVGVVRLRYPSRSFGRSEWTAFATLGGWVALTMATQFVGTDLTTASEGALITVLTPVFTVFTGVVVLDELLTRRRGVGVAVALAGTIVVLAGQYDLRAIGAGSAAGIAMLVVASAGWAAYTVWGKPLVRRYSALETATYSTAFAVPMLAALVPIELSMRGLGVADLPVTLPIVAAVLYLGVVSTAAAWYCWYKGLEYADAGTVAVYFFAQPLVGAALGALLLGESLGGWFLGGGLIMAVGIYVVSTDDTAG